MQKKEKNNLQKGFTLLELLVVLALVSIISGITLSNYSGMNKSVELQNTVYNVALSIREAQTYGINKKLKDTTNLTGTDDGFTDDNPFPYGLNVNLSTNTVMRIFRDKDIDSKFDGNCNPGAVECDRFIQLNSGNYISALWLDGTKYTTAKNINVIFKRPDPDALIVDDNNSSTVYSDLGIEISTANDIYTGCVEIGSAGDISLKQTCS